MGSESASRGRLAVLLDGGGARAAYQAGYLLGLGRLRPDLCVDVLVGVSAGAINAAYLASRPGSFLERAEGLAALWRSLDTGDVFDIRAGSLALRALRWVVRLGSGGMGPDPRGLLDNSPLCAFLGRVLEADERGRLPGIVRNLEAGDLKAVAITATSYGSGRSVTFVQGQSLRDWERPQRRSRQVEIGLEHVLASSALPFLFPAERLDDAWYGDGGIRLTSPLSPAIHLGADRILALSTRFVPDDEAYGPPDETGYPPPARVAGLLLDAIFLDALDGDALRLDRINRLLEGRPSVDLRPVDLWVTRPSADLGALATAHEHLLPWALRFLARGTGTRQTRSNDLLSLILFEGAYLGELLDRGEADARAHGAELERFLEGGPATWDEPTA